MHISHEYYHIQRLENFSTSLQSLKGIRLKYNSLTCDEFIKMEPELRRFENLTALDLSCNTIHLYQNDTVCERMSETLSLLPQLTRLDLSNNRIKQAAAHTTEHEPIAEVLETLWMRSDQSRFDLSCPFPSCPSTPGSGYQREHINGLYQKSWSVFL